MELSPPRFKALAVSSGFTFWFFIIISTLGIFSIEIFVIFVIFVFSLMQLLALRISKVLDVFAIYNTKFFLGLLFVTVITVYGLIFKLLQIDLMRLKKHKGTYWLQTEKSQSSRIFKEY